MAIVHWGDVHMVDERGRPRLYEHKVCGKMFDPAGRGSDPRTGDLGDRPRDLSRLVSIGWREVRAGETVVGRISLDSAQGLLRVVVRYIRVNRYRLIS
jgi:hypothetical protein